MRLFKYVILPILSFLLIGSCGAPKMTYDYDDATDFTQFKTFKISQSSQLNLKKSDSTSFINVFSKALNDKNLTFSDTPDLLIVIDREAHKAESHTSVGVGFGQQTRNVGINIGGAIPISRNATTQNLTIDFRTVKGNKLIWQSHASNTYKNGLPPNEKDLQLYHFFKSILKGYPPSKFKS